MAQANHKNPHIGGSALEYIEARRQEDADFDAGVQTVFDRIQLARQIKQLRERCSISQEQLARMVGTKQPAIARLESGRVVPSLDLLQKIAIALGVRLDISFV